MEGVILFADDHIYSEARPESVLFKSLRSDLPTLGVHSLELAESAIKSIGTFKALVLDWQYSPEDKFDDLEAELGEKISVASAQKEDAAYKFLFDNDFYSLIYIFSEKDIEEMHGESLRQKFGNRIKFKRKDENFTAENIDRFKEEILNDISEWEEDNRNLSIPVKWSQTINQCLQEIFYELAEADNNWIINLYQTATEDGVNPQIEVINLLQNLLGEKIITKVELLNEIKELVESSLKEVPVLSDGASVAKLFQRIYYTDLSQFSLEEVPIMTGDVFLLNQENKTYGIIISPECDVTDICSGPDMFFELLTFRESNFTLENFSSLFGPKDTKLTINNSALIQAINQVVAQKFTKLSPNLTPPQLFRKVRKRIVEGEGENRTVKKIDEYEPIEDDFLVRLFISQFEIVTGKYVDSELKVKINSQVKDQNQKLLYDLLLQAYNQTEKRIHLIPSFKFQSEHPNKTAVIDFRSGKMFRTFSELKEQGVKRICKLNNPFIPELRQRYLSYYGRVGVPKIPTVLREYNLKPFYPDAAGES